VPAVARENRHSWLVHASKSARPHDGLPAIAGERVVKRELFRVVKLRLRRMGAKKRPSYRIVAADSRSPRDGAFIEAVGFYDPITDPATINVNLDRARHWIDNGAQPTDTVRSILKRAGVYAEAAE
jgi:small subunit ribosomal protein S16